MKARAANATRSRLNRTQKSCHGVRPTISSAVSRLGALASELLLVPDRAHMPLTSFPRGY